jgi:4-carboxymuconolactone decarboxylase
MALTRKELELVAIGSAIAGNCIPCLEWHYQECVKLGFTPAELAEAVAMARKVKEVPSQKICEAAAKLNKEGGGGEPCCCQAKAEPPSKSCCAQP